MTMTTSRTTINTLAERPLRRDRLTMRRLVITLAALMVALLVIAVAAIAVGSEHVSISAIFKIILAEITGHPAGVTPEQRIIIADIRIPRAIMAIIVGAALSVAGAAYQALLRNPLADPGILGISSGAAIGALVATIFAESLPVSRPIAAFIGAVLTIGFVYALGQGHQGDSSVRLVLAGMITNALLSSIVIFLVTTASGSRQRNVLSGLIGNLGREERLLPLVASLVFVGIMAIYLNARSLNLLMIGEQDALALGVEVDRVKL